MTTDEPVAVTAVDECRGEELFPPENFAMVETGIYRSAFPRSKNIPFLRRLRLKSVIVLVPEEVSETMTKFYSSVGTRLVRHGTDGNKWPFKEIEVNEMLLALADVLNPANQPALIHCNKGKHRTGSLVGMIRKVRGWALSSIFAEYLVFALPKARLEDQRFIENFDDQAFFALMRLEKEKEKEKEMEGEGGDG